LEDMDETTAVNAMDEEWSLLVSFLPARWRELARETGALKGLRQDKDEETCLRVLLMHLACGYSLRETATRAREAQVAELSDVALFKRLRKSKEWLHALCRALLAEGALAKGLSAPQSLQLIDATIIQEPGPTGSSWRLHYSLRWPQLTCEHFALTPHSGAGTGESLKHYPVAQGEHLVADRAYAHYPGLAYVVAQGGQATVRFNPHAIRLLDKAGALFPLTRKLRGLKKSHEVASWPVQVTGARGQSPIAGRLCVARKSQAAIARACGKVKRGASHNGTKLRDETLFYAEYVMVFTTAPAEILAAPAVLELYRLRWQIELVFKRFKQLAQLGHLPKEDAESSQAWLYGKLFAALLAERLIQRAESFSPWGYDVAPSTEPESMARV
jgi:hypothetical protein